MGFFNDLGESLGDAATRLFNRAKRKAEQEATDAIENTDVVISDDGISLDTGGGDRGPASPASEPSTGWGAVDLRDLARGGTVGGIGTGGKKQVPTWVDARGRTRFGEPPWWYKLGFKKPPTKLELALAAGGVLTVVGLGAAGAHSAWKG